MSILINDTFSGVDDDDWDAVTWPIVRDAVDPSDFELTIQDNRGSMVTGSVTFSRALALTADDIADVDITVWHRRTALVNCFPEIGYRISANVISGRPVGYALGPHQHGGSIWLWKMDGDAYTGVTRTDLTFNDLDARYYRIRCKGARHQIKWWRDTDPEPPVWNMDTTDHTYLAPGRAYLACYNDSSAISAVTIEWDDFTLEEIVPAPAGFRVGVNRDLADAIYMGDTPIDAAFLGDTELVVP